MTSRIAIRNLCFCSLILPAAAFHLSGQSSVQITNAADLPPRRPPEGQPVLRLTRHRQYVRRQVGEPIPPCRLPTGQTLQRFPSSNGHVLWAERRVAPRSTLSQHILAAANTGLVDLLRTHLVSFPGRSTNICFWIASHRAADNVFGRSFCRWPQKSRASSRARRRSVANTALPQS